MHSPIEITFHGAAGTLTGSCMELRWHDKRVLIDCGLFQGSRSLEHLNWAPFPFEPSRIDAVLLSHAHQDHSGLLPRLMTDGFTGAIWCTFETRDLLPALLADVAVLHQAEVTRRNLRYDRADKEPFAPFFTNKEVNRVIDHIQPIAAGTWFLPAEGMGVRFHETGHMLGAVSIEILADRQRLLFSGDVGPAAKRPRNAELRGFDHIVCEATLGDKIRKRITPADRRLQLHREVDQALRRGGNLIIPAFGVECTEDLICDLSALAHDLSAHGHDVFVDLPLSGRVALALNRCARRTGATVNNRGTSRTGLHFVETVEDSKALNKRSGQVIIAASGMCEAGRIRHHLRHNLPRPDSTILLTGYQARGTLGRTLVDGADRVRISGHDVRVRAQMRTLDGYSAHADQHELLRWLATKRSISGSLFLTHAETSAREALATLAAGIKGINNPIIQPYIGETYRLLKGSAAVRICEAAPGIEEWLAEDWQNAYAAIVANLKHRLEEMPTDAKRRTTLQAIQKLLDERSPASAAGATAKGHPSPQRQLFWAAGSPADTARSTVELIDQERG